MVWLSLDKENYLERLLLMHTEVPVGGSFKFYVKPGDYQIRASDEAGCEFIKKVIIRGEDSLLDVVLKKNEESFFSVSFYLCSGLRFLASPLRFGDYQGLVS